MVRTAIPILLAACSGAGSNAAPPPDDPAAATAEAEPAGARSEASALLSDLRQRLAEVRAAAPDQHVETGPVDAAGLSGVHRGVIENALGAPHTCRGEGETPAPAPCEQPDDVFYSFYHLPEGSVGGGPELLLRYDETDRCAQAMWRFTQ
jgi:hypothetical protein